MSRRLSVPVACGRCHATCHHRPVTHVTDVVARLRAAGCVFAEDEARVLAAAAGPAELERMIEERIVRGLPLEHVVGWAEFRGLRVLVEPGVFVPRRRTEFLVERARALTSPDCRTVVDLCCGSGAVGLALLAELPQASVHAVDLDPVAVRCAERNFGSCGHIRAGWVYEGDLDEPLPRRLAGQVDLLVVNAPYVPTEAIPLMPAEARVHEPGLALDGGADGLDIQRRIAAAAPRWLASGGHILVETGADQAAQTAAILTSHGLTTELHHSAAHEATVVAGTRS